MSAAGIDRFVDGTTAITDAPIFAPTDEQIAAVRAVCARHNADDLLPMILGGAA